MKLKISPVTSSQPPQSSSPARVRSVRAARPASHNPATSRISAAGSSQEIWPPTSVSNIRSRPDCPENGPPPPPPIRPAPPTLPSSSPVIRPRPL
ncbi:hypothetical protein B0E53_04667 [Micromonospora sp. MH33]|nr:hypothetical protein B0E53_04667 [Micromonospora sp. MH33]